MDEGDEGEGGGEESRSSELDVVAVRAVLDLSGDYYEYKGRTAVRNRANGWRTVKTRDEQFGLPTTLLRRTTKPEGVRTEDKRTARQKEDSLDDADSRVGDQGHGRREGWASWKGGWRSKRTTGGLY